MSEFFQELSKKIINSDGYKEATYQLFNAYINNSVKEKYSMEVGMIRKIASTVQYFYKSSIENYTKEGAILLSMLLNVAENDTPELKAIAENVYYNSGDFPNLKLLELKYPDITFRGGIYNELLKELRLELNTVENIDQTLTDYQRSLWEYLVEDNDIITSAPTSTGKTYTILRYLIQSAMKSDNAFFAVVVPTRALISELSKKIFEIAKANSFEKKIEICSVPKDGPFKDITFFVMTQERLFEILQVGDISFDYLFIDEAHNISDKSRGVLLHLTLQRLLEDSFPQIIISMPSDEYENAFNSVFNDVEFHKWKTKHSPVAKIVMDVELVGRRIKISRTNKKQSVFIDKKFKGNKIADIIYRLGQGETNIVYRNRPYDCENFANQISDLIEQKENKALNEASDYVKRIIHKDFSLVNNLKKGVAFHYGPLPGVMRKMIEDLVRQKEIEFIACTSTLAEGVNLPAKNLFLNNPVYRPFLKSSERLETVKIENITGRAGRLLEHFAGNIYLIEPEKWTFKDYFDEKEKKADKIPTYFMVLNENLDSIFEALQGRYGFDQENQYTYYTIANKLLKEYNNDTLANTFDAEELSLKKNQLKKLRDQIEDAYNNLKVDTFTLEANPTVGFIQQNILHGFLKEQKDLKEWVLPHPKSEKLYNALYRICHALNQAGIFIPQKASNVGFACKIAKKWMIGDPLKSIIIDQINDDKKNGEKYDCNRSVRTVISIINTDVRFRMSSALRCYNSIITDLLGAQNVEMKSMKIYSFLEVGGCDERMINLINLGLSRETSIEIHETLPGSVKIDSMANLKKIFDDGKLSHLHVIAKREIKNLIT